MTGESEISHQRPKFQRYNQNNGIEQLLVNTANEVVENFILAEIFQKETETYTAEHIKCAIEVSLHSRLSGFSFLRLVKCKIKRRCNRHPRGVLSSENVDDLGKRVMRSWIYRDSKLSGPEDPQQREDFGCADQETVWSTPTVGWRVQVSQGWIHFRNLVYNWINWIKKFVNTDQLCSRPPMTLSSNTATWTISRMESSGKLRTRRDMHVFFGDFSISLLNLLLDWFRFLPRKYILFRRNRSSRSNTSTVQLGTRSTTS